MRVSYSILATIGVWIVGWFYFIMFGFDILFHFGPFVLLLLALLFVRDRKTKQTGFRQTPLISPLTAVLLSIGSILIFVMSMYYPSMMLLMWNVQAILTVVLAYHISTSDLSFVMSNNSRGEVL
jgi:amino acid transporter